MSNLITINTINQQNLKLLLFPDNQPHVIVSGVKSGDSVRLVCPLKSSLDLIQLLEISEALGFIGAFKDELIIPYLLGGRSDRHIVPGDSFDLAVVAELINICEFGKVTLLDCHSDTSTRLIWNSFGVSNDFLVERYTLENSVLICPDKGARTKVERYLKKNPNLVEVVYCEKQRDLHTGQITLKVLKPEMCYGRNCVIIDDIADGGGTFLQIADQITPKFLTLIVTHGIFSKGFSSFKGRFDKIIVSDSFRSSYDFDRVQVVPVSFLWEDKLAISDPYFSTDVCVERLLREWRVHKKLIVAVDMDDSIFDYHNLGYKYHKAIEILKECQNLGFYICVFTGSPPSKYESIEKYVKDLGIQIASINKNPFPLPFGNDGKMYYNILLDDRAGAGQAYETLKKTIELIRKEISQ